MSLEKAIMDQMKAAMKAKDTIALQALRAVKSAFLLAKTEGSNHELTEQDEVKIIQKQVKQRKDSAAVFMEQGREDLAEPELKEAEILAQFLPEALSASMERPILAVSKNGKSTTLSSKSFLRP